jgi:signal transduction histidine kinase
MGFGSAPLPYGRRMLLLSRASYGLLLLAGIATIYLAFRTADAQNWVQHTLNVRTTARTLFIEVQDAVIRERGYLLTENSAYAGEAEQALAGLSKRIDDLQVLIADNTEQSARLAKLEPAVLRLRDTLAQTVMLVRRGQREAALEVVRSNIVIDLTKSIDALLTDFIKSEDELLIKRQGRAATLQNLLLLLIGISLAIAVGLSMILEVSTRHFVHNLQTRTDELEAEVKRRQETEATLRQAQKMEAIGQLTGGIAHDFNNLLTVIMGNLDTAKRRLASFISGNASGEGSSKLEQLIDTALHSSRNAAKLTHRLLAFARRQPLEPARIDCNRLISDMSDLLTRTLGETIHLESVLSGGLWPTFADPSQLESALLNLAVNAQHAMPDGGLLTIETANSYLDEAYTSRFGDLEAGQYVQISVADTGTGIAPEILDRVFEPFFTTKPAEAGSGLGLAMVHGFVKQSGGHVRIYSELGHGTTVKIYLPRLMATQEMAASPAGTTTPAGPAEPAKANEAVLVVEDNDDVRAYARGALQDLGYTVHEAADAEAALKIVESGARIDLLFTDVVLPGGVSGRQLSDRILKLKPGLPVLFTTGYTRNAIVHHGRLDPDVQLLNKPYAQQDLGRMVRRVLNRAAQSP